MLHRLGIVGRLAAGLSLLAFAACGGGGTTPSNTSGGGISTMSVSIMDAPFQSSTGTVSAVNIDIAKVELVGNGGNQTLVTFSPSEQINLLNYQTSPFALGTATFPAGQYQQMRFVLDDSSPNNNSVVINGTTYPLSIPSATGMGFGGNTSTDNGDGPGTAGVKVNIGLRAQAGVSYGFLIDFNAAESLVATGNGGWIMKPVLVATPQSLAGSISGSVKNVANTAVDNAEILAEQNGQPVNSGVTDANGNFQINALPTGTYTLVIENSWTNLAGQSETATGADGTAPVTVANPVIVTAGQATTVTLSD
ncbi:MAG: DUF4382 domain-containing protein [Vulcanimicrobiaceae bacterium]